MFRSIKYNVGYGIDCYYIKNVEERNLCREQGSGPALCMYGRWCGSPRLPATLLFNTFQRMNERKSHRAGDTGRKVTIMVATLKKAGAILFPVVVLGAAFWYS